MIDLVADKTFPLHPVTHEFLFKNYVKDLSLITNYEIKSIELINNPGQTRLFHGCIEKVEAREKMPEFQPNLEIETSPAEREEVMKQVQHVMINQLCRLPDWREM